MAICRSDRASRTSDTGSPADPRPRLLDAGSWVITYDADRRVPNELYRGLRCAVFGIKHTAAVQHIGEEYAVFSRGLMLPSLELLGHNARLIA